MPKIKSHKTVFELAKKHNVDVSFIERQLKMGKIVELEHTKDKDLAHDIALQHLDEIPDYYTRLKKLESSKKLKEETKSGDSNLRDWFNDSSGKDPKTGRRVKGWVQLGGPFAGAPCARQPGQKSTPKCGSSKMAKNLSPEEEDKAWRRKNREDPNQPEKTGAAKPTNVRTENMELQEKKGKKDACYRKVKSRYDVWPSAYASGALVKCRKVGAANWGTKSEEIENISIVEKILGEEKCGEGMYWCNTDKVCKPLPDGFNTPGQSIKPTEVGIGKPVEGSSCNHTGKGKKCPVHGTKDCSMKESNDHEYSMIRSELSTIRNAIHRLQKKVKSGEGEVEAWVQSKITKAADYLDSAADYVDSGEMQEMRNPLKDPGTQIKRSTGAGALTPEAAKQLGPIAQNLRKKAASKVSLPKVRKEAIAIEDANGNVFAEVIDIIKPEPIKGFKSQIDEASRIKAQSGKVIMITLLWRGKYYSLKMFFPQVKMPSRQDLNSEIQKVYPGGRVIYHSVSEFNPGEPLIQSCGPNGGSFAKPGPSKNYVKTMGEEVELDEDWQEVNRKDKTDGLSPAAVKAYRRENPGSKLQTAVTEKNPRGKRKKRRASFCRRMSGMKSKLTSAKTARDPNSRINKALRRWNCR